MEQNTLTVKVVRKTPEAQDICSFELQSADAAVVALPAFTAGAHIDVHLPGGLVRQYSLCNDPSEQHRYVIGVLRDPQSRGGSQAMHDAVHEGDVLQISAPKNHFPLNEGGARSLLMAGGIGITPVLAMAQRLAALGADFALHYSTRNLAKTAFWQHIGQSRFADKAHLHCDEGEGAGRVDLDALLAQPAPGTHLYVCGPKGYMDAVLETARAKGWAADNLHSEFFAGEVVVNDSDSSFEVEIASTGQRIEVPQGVTVAKALAAAGVEVMTACEQGVCGTCITRVLAGVPDHRDSYLTPEERQANDQFMPCCSRSCTPVLRLDL